MSKTWGRIRIRIWTGIKMESLIRISIIYIYTIVLLFIPVLSDSRSFGQVGSGTIILNPFPNRAFLT